MARYVALLGGINVGGHRVKMETLRDVFSDLGFAHVSTFIASGNVVFDAPNADAEQLEQIIEERLKQSLGYAVPTFLRTRSELAAVVALSPFAPEEMETAGYTVHVGFLRDALPVGAEHRIAAFQTERDAFCLYNRELYWLCRGKTTESLVAWPKLTKAVPLPALTLRNMTTVRKLVAAYPAE